MNRNKLIRNNMKNIFKTGILALLSVLLMTSCDPQENNEYGLGTTPTETDLSFTATPSSSKANIIVLKNTSSVSGVATWNLGNGATAKGESVEAQYPFAGTYTVSLTLYTTGGSATVTKQIIIAEDDMSLLDTPMYNALTGGADNLAGKTWVFDEYHDGHFGIGPVLNDDGSISTSPSWWSCPASGKEGSSLYKQEFTFIQVGVKMIWKNNGYIYTNANGKNALGINDFIENPGGVGDFDVAYTPQAEYTFALDENEKTLTLSNDAFFGHYAGTSTYKIESLTDDALYLSCASKVESGNKWWYRFIPKEKNVKPVVPVKAVALAENFEKEKLSVDFKREEMGTLQHIYANPAPVPVNESKLVYLYQKTSAFYSNISYTVTGYKFDLTEMNKVRMKVYIPSYNNYEDVFATAGDWVTINKLQSQVAVKLQNSNLGTTSYTTQTEIVKANLQKDRWLELEFDFSSVKDRKDYDKIVIQFGGEGHAAPGIFFFDDFSFNK